MSDAYVPALSGVHHLKLPVRDLERSRDWYATRLGYAVAMEFVEDGVLKGYAMDHPAGGPSIALRRDPARAELAAGFDYFAIGVATKADLDALAGHLDALGDTHAGVHFASVGWILPMLHDPDGHEVRFYTWEKLDPAERPPSAIIHNPKERALERERLASN